MTNRREFKKHVRYLCGDIAAECILAKYFSDNNDAKKLDELVIKVADLQQSVLSRANLDFDKTPKFFANASEYNKARKEFMAKAFKSLYNSFYNEVNSIVKELNAILTDEQKRLNKESIGK